MSLAERFWDKVVKSAGCWKWTGSKTKGYGRICVGGRGRNIGAHRASWILHFGEIPNGLFVLHKCDNPQCTRPNHLFLGTQRENVVDRVSKGRDGDHSGEKNGRAKITEKQVIEIRKLHALGDKSYRDIGNIYGVHPTHIGYVIKRGWKNVGVPA